MSINCMKRARLHRFAERVALYIKSDESGPTVYMTASQARSLARELNRYAKEIDGCKFADSKIGTKELE